MIIKKFVGKNEEEATSLAKKDLGENLVIMNVRKVKAKPPFAFLKSKRVEVTAAIEEEDPGMERIRKIARAQDSAQKAATQQAPQTLAQPVPQSQPAASVQPKATGQTVSVTSASSVNIEAKLDNLQNMLEKKLGTAAEPNKEEKPAPPMPAGGMGGMY